MERELLRQLRIKHNLTQLELGEKLGISEVYARKLEKGVANPGTKTMLKYEDFFQVNMRTLFPDIFFDSSDKKFIVDKKSPSKEVS